MTDSPLSYDDLIGRLNDAEEVVHTLVSDQVDAVISENGVQLLRLHETDRALRIARVYLERMLTQRTAELVHANERLMQEIAERRSAERRLSAIIESAMDAIITVDEEMNVVIFNTSAEKIFRCAAADAIGKPLDRFIPESEGETHRTRLRRLAENGAKTGGASESVDMLYGVRCGGDAFPIEATFSHVDAGGEHLYTVILRDITRRKETEAALIRSEKLASVGRLAAMITHEINNPLSSINNILYLLKDDPTRPNARQYLEVAETELQRAAKIARNTLSFSRQAGALPEPFRLCEAVDGILILLRRELENKGITLETQCLPGQVELVAVASEVKQVLWNLLTNAVDAVPAKTGRITVRISQADCGNARRDRGVRITVADNGVGMKRETMRQVLEPFYTTKSNGTGLGLWVSSEIVKRHSGWLRVRSRTDAARHGTVFSLSSSPTPSPFPQAAAESRSA